SVRLGDWEAAAAQAKAALDGVLPPKERTAAHVVMGIAHTLGGAYETASAAFERALMHASRCEVPERCRTDVRYEQANSLVSQLRYREAVTVLEPLVDSLRQARRIALARAWLGASYQALGDFDAARSQIEMALATEGLEPFDEAEVLTNAAGVYGDFGELEKVSQLQRRGLNLVREQLGPSHPYTLTQLNNQALALKNLGRFAEAEAMLRQVVRERTEAYGPDNVDLSATHFNLAHALVLQERLEEALVSFEEAIRVGSLAWPSSPRMGLFKVIYADALSRLGRSRQAETFFASGLALMPVNADGSLHPLTARTRVRFAAFASERGRHPQALKTFVEVAPVLREVYGPDSRQYAECQWYHGLALQRAGRLEEGKATLLEAVNSLEASPYRALYQKEIERGRSQLP
ncbi:MAG: tetratricopeptide repeat protein, partial [Myxococcota bacterium]